MLLHLVEVVLKRVVELVLQSVEMKSQLELRPAQTQLQTSKDQHRLLATCKLRVVVTMRAHKLALKLMAKTE
jgi:hypothetical protein